MTPTEGRPRGAGKGVADGRGAQGLRDSLLGQNADQLPAPGLPKGEVERAVDYATRSFPDVLDLVPDFSVLTVGRDLESDETAVLVLGDEREAREFRRVAGEGSLEGLLWEVALRVRSRRRSASLPR